MSVYVRFLTLTLLLTANGFDNQLIKQTKLLPKQPKLELHTGKGENYPLKMEGILALALVANLGNSSPFHQHFGQIFSITRRLSMAHKPTKSKNDLNNGIDH